VYPTPVIGMVGLIENRKFITPSAFQSAGDDIVLLGTNRGDINGSEYVSALHGICGADAPYFDIQEEKRLHECTLELIHAGLIRSAHDVSDGGIIVTLIESATCGVECTGFSVEVRNGMRMDHVLFGEEQSRIVVSAQRSKRETIMDVCTRHGVPAAVIGSVTNDATGHIQECVTIDLHAAKNIMSVAIGERMEEVVSAIL
jgi:phosphoribosylformylglycinamidine synthase subunit PurL